MAQTTVYESAHKGDFETVKNAVDASPTLISKQDDVCMTFITIN